MHNAEAASAEMVTPATDAVARFLPNLVRSQTYMKRRFRKRFWG